MNNTKAVHWILGVALLMIGVFVVVALVMVNSQADDVATDVSIDNISPSVDSIFVSDGQYDLVDDYGGAGGTITGLTAGGATTYHVNGVVSDENGDDDIYKVSAVLYQTDVVQTCTDDNNSCYSDDTDSNCTIDTTYGDSTEAKFDCALDVYFYAVATEAGANASWDTWTVYVEVEDDDASTDTDTLSKEMGSMLGLNIPSTIDFGTLALGALTTSGNNYEMSIEQYGNKSADVLLSGTALTCDGSDAGIPMGNVKADIVDIGHDQGGSQMSGTPSDMNLGIGERTIDGTPKTKILYWNIAIPATGVEGECTGTTTITAKAAD
jgi:hypothetical protein